MSPPLTTAIDLGAITSSSHCDFLRDWRLRTRTPAPPFSSMNARPRAAPLPDTHLGNEMGSFRKRRRRVSSLLFRVVPFDSRHLSRNLTPCLPHVRQIPLSKFRRGLRSCPMIGAFPLFARVNDSSPSQHPRRPFPPTENRCAGRERLRRLPLIQISKLIFLAARLSFFRVQLIAAGFL
jgi:hypothetical protein